VRFVPISIPENKTRQRSRSVRKADKLSSNGLTVPFTSSGEVDSSPNHFAQSPGAKMPEESSLTIGYSVDIVLIIVVRGPPLREIGAFA
jgi:hypothetical protein